MSVFSEYVWTVGRPNQAKKKKWVFKQKGIRVDGAWVATDPFYTLYFVHGTMTLNNDAFMDELAGALFPVIEKHIKYSFFICKFKRRAKAS